jgi:hypothetical protein
MRPVHLDEDLALVAEPKVIIVRVQFSDARTVHVALSPTRVWECAERAVWWSVGAGLAVGAALAIWSNVDARGFLRNLDLIVWGGPCVAAVLAAYVGRWRFRVELAALAERYGRIPHYHLHPETAHAVRAQSG